MSIVEEIEKAIASLPIKEAYLLRHWLNEYEAAHEYKKLKIAQAQAKASNEFRQDGNSYLN
jgi:hypothetical protein